MRKFYQVIGITFVLLIFHFTPKTLNAQTWLPKLGQGVDDAPYSFVNAIIEYQGDIIIAGEFSSVSGIPCAFVARWNGSTWAAMGSGLPAVGKCFAIYNNELYAGVDAIGSSTLHKWSGTAWVASGPFTEPINALYVDPATNTFYAGGLFTTPGKYVAKLNGTNWVGMGTLPAGTSSFPGVNAISVHNGTLYVGGTYGGGTSTQYFAKWNNISSFVNVHADQPNQPVFSFAHQDGNLYIGGAFSKIGAVNTRCVAQWDGTDWVAMATDFSGPNTAFGGVKSISSYKGQIYAAGVFSIISVTGLEANNVARWNGCSWKNLTDGVSTIGINDEGYATAVIGDDLYIGGKFKNAGGLVDANRIVGWNNVVECPDPICFALVPEINITSDLMSGCAGSTFNFSVASINNEGSAPQYQWMVDGSPVGTNSTSFSSSSLTDGQIVTCVLTSDDPCNSSTTGTSNAITVSIVTQLTPTITVTADQISICSGQTVNFNAATSGGGLTPSYAWKIDGSAAGTNSASFSSAGLTDGQVVSCVLTSSETCANPTTANSNNVTITVTPAVTPTINISSSLTEICAGNNVTFVATITNGGTGPSYQWQVNSANVGTNSASFSSTTLTDGQVVTCILTSNVACASSTNANSNSITMSVIAEANISLTGGELSTTTAGTSFQWVDCGSGNPISGETNNTFTPTVSGSYRVDVNMGTCTVSSACVTATVGLDENALSSQVKLMPNPTKDLLFVSTKTLTLSEYELCDVSGKILTTNKINQNEFQIDLSGRENGIYFIRFTTNDKNSFTQKIIKN